MQLMNRPSHFPVLRVELSREAMIDAARRLLIERLRASLQFSEQVTVALSGGSTPQPLYEALAKEALPWHRIHVFLTDERYVDQEDSRSNFGMIKRLLLEKITIPDSNIHPMPTDFANPVDAATAYDARLKQVFSCSANELPSFDLVLLGLGEDGHTASLFPRTEALHVTDKLATVGFNGSEPRITLTLPVLNNAKNVMFLATGKNKRRALDEALIVDGDDFLYPVRMIRPTRCGVIWFVDNTLG